MSDRQIDYPEGSKEHVVATARALGVCRICQMPVVMPQGNAVYEAFETITNGQRLRVKYGREFAHAHCLDDPNNWRA